MDSQSPPGLAVPQTPMPAPNQAPGTCPGTPAPALMIPSALCDAQQTPKLGCPNPRRSPMAVVLPEPPHSHGTAAPVCQRHSACSETPDGRTHTKTQRHSDNDTPHPPPHIHHGQRQHSRPTPPRPLSAVTLRGARFWGHPTHLSASGHHPAARHLHSRPQTHRADSQHAPQALRCWGPPKVHPALTAFSCGSGAAPCAPTDMGERDGCHRGPRGAALSRCRQQCSSTGTGGGVGRRAP